MDPEGTDDTLGGFNFPDFFSQIAGRYLWNSVRSRLIHTPVGQFIHYTLDSAVNPRFDPPLSSMQVASRQQQAAGAAAVVCGAVNAAGNKPADPLNKGTKVCVTYS